MEIRLGVRVPARKNEAPRLGRQHTHDELVKRPEPAPPQCPEGWNFESLTGQSESDCAFRVDREEVGGDSRSQFVDLEDASRHGGEAKERKGEVRCNDMIGGGEPNQTWTEVMSLGANYNSKPSAFDEDY